MPRDIRLAEVKDLVGQEIGVSKWFTVDQTIEIDGAPKPAVVARGLYRFYA